VAGVSLEEFFARYVAGAEQLDVNEYLSDAGLRADVRREVAPQDVGIYFNRANNRIVGLVNGGAGYDSGLQPGDTVLSINGEPIQTRPFTEFFKKEERVGSTYTFRVTRADTELTFDVEIKQRETVTVQIVETVAATTRQLKVRRGLLSGWSGASEGQKARLTAGPSAPHAFLPAS
jgi:predicted metalloprotease with PDZ domain